VPSVYVIAFFANPEAAKAPKNVFLVVRNFLGLKAVSCAKDIVYCTTPQRTKKKEKTNTRKLAHNAQMAILPGYLQSAHFAKVLVTLMMAKKKIVQHSLAAQPSATPAWNPTSA
jgi:hypothetical protein